MATHKLLPAEINPEDITARLANLETGWHRYHCKLVTPMYGGGVEAGKVDEKMPIRATAIRGQLRFWWRIAHRSRFIRDGQLDSQAMFQCERELWGGLGDAEELTASKVAVLIENTGTARFKNSKDQTDPAEIYAFGAAANNGAAQWLAEGFTWGLALNSPGDCWPEVENALFWWASFGGVGARCRRGFGALEIADVLTNEALNCIDADTARLSGCELFLGKSAQNAAAAWKAANDKMRLFRQGPDLGRKTKSQGNTNGQSPGRSHWPEPDAIRRITQRWFGKNLPLRHRVKNRNTGQYEPIGDPHDHTPAHPAGNIFPRAAFGLPIIFKFKDDRDGDPQSSTLVPVGKERMASPIILRPYRSKNSWLPMALVLPTDEVWKMQVQLKQGERPPQNGMSWWPVNSGEEVAEKIPPMKARGNDPIKAFVAYFNEEPDSNRVVRPPKCVAAETRVDGARLKLNRANGSISVAKNGTETIALKDDAAKLLASLSANTRLRLNNPNEYVRVNAVIVGREIKSLEDAA